MSEGQFYPTFCVIALKRGYQLKAMVKAPDAWGNCVYYGVFQNAQKVWRWYLFHADYMYNNTYVPAIEESVDNMLEGSGFKSKAALIKNVKDTDDFDLTPHIR
jgi:hypothetical protein